MVTSTVHLTGNPNGEVKDAMSKLLARSTNKFCTKKGKWVGDAQVRALGAEVGVSAAINFRRERGEGGREGGGREKRGGRG